MVHTDEEYVDGIRELGHLIENEDSLDDTALNHLRNLGEALISYERRNVLSTGDSFVPTAQARAEYEASKRGEEIADGSESYRDSKKVLHPVAGLRLHR